MIGVNTNSEVIEKAKELDVKFLHLQFTDISGSLKNITVPADQISKVLNNEISFNGSYIGGYADVQDSDKYLYPDIATFEIINDSMPSEASFICDIYNADRSPFAGCPRGILKRALERAGENSFEFFVGAESEFYLLELDEKGRPTVRSADSSGYLDYNPEGRGEIIRAEMTESLRQMGFEIESSHHEIGFGQHEIVYKFSDALKAADDFIIFKQTVRAKAKKYELHASFMPKISADRPGSGLHLNLSLFKDSINAFYDPYGQKELSSSAYKFISGLIRHSDAVCAFCNPTVNSYKRIIGGDFAPAYTSWSFGNRSSMIRVPSARDHATRVELRGPDSSVNPYLAFAVLLISGLDGIENDLPQTGYTEKNLYEADEEDLRRDGIKRLPVSLLEAVEAFEKDSCITEFLGEDISKRYAGSKRNEWEAYYNRVSDWEIDTYLKTL